MMFLNIDRYSLKCYAEVAERLCDRLQNWYAEE